MTYNVLMALIGAALLGAACGVVGIFAVVRGRALVGDALAHAALPGVGLAFLVTGSRALPVLLAGALVAGLVGAWCLAALRRRRLAREDAALALVLSTFFGAGIALSRHIQNVMPGGAKAGLDSFLFGKAAGIVIADVIGIAAAATVVGVAVVVAYRRFLLVSFDADFAGAIGWRPERIDAALMACVTLVVIVGLPMVGVVLTAALVVIPAVAARLWTGSLARAAGLAALFGAIAGTLGVLASAEGTDLATGPAVILSGGVIFVVSAIAAPHGGLLVIRARRRRMRHDWVARILVGELTRRPMTEAQAVEWLSQRQADDPWGAIRSCRERGWIEAGEILRATESGLREVGS
jgi:manganese/zinc/iron transport system permease protein